MSGGVDRKEQLDSPEAERLLSPAEKRYILYALGDQYNLGDETDPEYQRWQKEQENPTPHAYSQVRDKVVELRQEFIEKATDPEAIDKVSYFLEGLQERHKESKERAMRAVKYRMAEGTFNMESDMLFDGFELFGMSPYGLTLDPQAESTSDIIAALTDKFRPEGLTAESDEKRGLFELLGMETSVPGVVFRVRKDPQIIQIDFGATRQAELIALKAPIIEIPALPTPAE